jgi:hypothetical protein
MFSKLLKIAADAEKDGSHFQNISGEGANQYIFSYQVKKDISEKTLQKLSDDKNVLESPEELPLVKRRQLHSGFLSIL